MNNKIEEGCLAMVVRSCVPENIGKVGKVGKYLGKVKGFITTDNWQFSTPTRTKKGYYINFMPETYLMRINPDAKLDLTEEKKHVNVPVN